MTQSVFIIVIMWKRKIVECILLWGPSTKRFKGTDYFELLPNEILIHIFSFTSLKSLWTLFSVNKRFNSVIKSNDMLVWKNVCLNFFKIFMDRNFDAMSRDEKECYNLEKVQEDSGKDWIWFARCFTHGKIYAEYYSNIVIAASYSRLGIKNGYAIYLQEDGVYYIGNFKNDYYHGKGLLLYNKLRVKYKGNWRQGRPHGKTLIDYSDGLKHECFWWNGKLKNYSIVLHPSVKDCLQKGLCTNNIGRMLPQNMTTRTLLDQLHTRRPKHLVLVPEWRKRM
jgi:hypothetical protein